MKPVKEFVEEVLRIASEDMADGSDYWPHAYFLMPDEGLDIFVIDPNFMATGNSTNVLRALMLKHLHTRGAIYAVFVSDTWMAEAEIPKGGTYEQTLAGLPDDLSTYSGRTECLVASVFGEGLEPILAKWPYSRVAGKPQFLQGALQYVTATDGEVRGRFAPDLTHGQRPV